LRPAQANEYDRSSAFVEENVRVVAPPRRAPLPIFSDENSESHARALVAVLATFAKLQHPVAQFVARYRPRWSGAPVWPTRQHFNAAWPETNTLSKRLSAQAHEQDRRRNNSKLD
jgi:hypothetical protein